mmetsp:Transcript_41989/g.75386  ORF Transcript_41989/g.75386 Transcript_41989/m.75386 type:complete len:259 (+) Transcript_41989:1592-2368(+)
MKSWDTVVPDWWSRASIAAPQWPSSVASLAAWRSTRSLCARLPVRTTSSILSTGPTASATSPARRICALHFPAQSLSRRSRFMPAPAKQCPFRDFRVPARPAAALGISRRRAASRASLETNISGKVWTGTSWAALSVHLLVVRLPCKVSRKSGGAWTARPRWSRWNRRARTVARRTKELGMLGRSCASGGCLDSETNSLTTGGTRVALTKAREWVRCPQPHPERPQPVAPSTPANDCSAHCGRLKRKSDSWSIYAIPT